LFLGHAALNKLTFKLRQSCTQ
jgi:hypothetical protein